jgi:hypothetical protein
MRVTIFVCLDPRHDTACVNAEAPCRVCQDECDPMYMSRHEVVIEPAEEKKK